MIREEFDFTQWDGPFAAETRALIEKIKKATLKAG